ncbi:MAG: C40 family peptidase [Selenomonadaceae bacterium]|nr:C40 family peptidase [Selenomonadaceae bacterium]
MKFKLTLAVIIALTLLSSTALASPTLSKNSRGNDVLTLQKKLYLIGYEITELDGVYGNETEKAVSAFQRDNKISVTGIVTNVTWRALRKAKEKKGRTLPAITVKPTPAVKPIAGLLSGEQGNSIVATAKTFMGVPYVFGGTTPKGFDCSGLVQYVFKLNGVNIPRLADEQYNLGKSATRSQLVAGDLVFFDTEGGGITHCGIYVGGGNFLHASSSRGVRIDSLDNEYWKPRFVGAKKIVNS